MENKNTSQEMQETKNTTTEKWYDKGNRFIDKARIVVAVLILLFIGSKVVVNKNADNSVSIKFKSEDGTTQNIATVTNDSKKGSNTKSEPVVSKEVSVPAKKKTYSEGTVSIAGNKLFFNDRFYEGYPELQYADFFSGNERWEVINNMGLPELTLTDDMTGDRRLPSRDGSFSWRLPYIEKPHQNISYVVGQPDNFNEEMYTLEYADGRNIQMISDGSKSMDGGGQLSYQDVLDIIDDIRGMYPDDDLKFEYVENSALVMSAVKPESFSGIIFVVDSAANINIIKFDYLQSTFDQLKADMALVKSGLGFESNAAPIKRIPYGRANILADEIRLYDASGAPKVIDNRDHYLY